MFDFFKKKKEKEIKGTEVGINESLLKTKDAEVIRCENIKAHFNTKSEEDGKKVSSDMLRQCMITTGYTVTMSEAVGNKEAFAEAIEIEANRVIAKESFLCDKITIDKISRVEVSR